MAEFTQDYTPYSFRGHSYKVTKLDSLKRTFQHKCQRVLVAPTQPPRNGVSKGATAVPPPPSSFVSLQSLKLKLGISICRGKPK